ncbi:DUF5074 domain-containing protein [uncultured Prevotella sp.]|uniref:YncE family protein n=1 Tax=uncultured Prevotella sp. TaxID=159272 RepID=UPI002584EC0B|nr:DUF5074 domain-containing protein [uncultured Prevotella sp.]
MKKYFNTLIRLAPILLLVLTAAGCRQDDTVIYPDEQNTGAASSGSIKGMYVLNEGNMGSNKATLDYLDFATGTYSRNIYPSRNPGEVMELGDVGNDIKIYGQRLWMSINQSNKVEVARAADAVSIGHVDIPNCRSLAFDKGFAYVSSYVGQVNGRSVLGQVYKVDTASLRIVATCTVGYQPEEMAVVGNRLYVANSGGYNAMQGMGYDRTVSVIDLSTFSVVKTISVAPNLFRVKADRYGSVWVSSRGDYASVPSRLYEIYNDEVVDSVDVPVDGFDIHGDSLVYYGNHHYGVIDLRTGRIVNSDFIRQSPSDPIRTPYSIIVQPVTGDVFVMDATNYVSSGKLFCFSRDGKYKWSTWTGDIPGHACFTSEGSTTATGPQPTTPSAYISAVDEYRPAPGQFVNVLPQIDADDNADSAAAKCTKAIAGSMNGLITLGAYGGYVTFHFDHRVRNLEGNDLMIKGNAFNGNSEPGIVMVSVDANHNGKPDDEWYELRGSADADSVGKVVYGYSITYNPSPMADIPWTDNRGGSGVVYRNSSHQQEYFPLWVHGSMTFTGTLLPRNGRQVNVGGGVRNWFLDSFAWGYVDNSGTDEGCSFDISNAVDSQRRPVSLEAIDFVRVYSAENQYCGWLGETSTEVCGAMDLHTK